MTMELRNLIRQIISESYDLREYIQNLPEDPYVSMNFKNFRTYEKELALALKDKLESSKGNFQKFLNSVIKKQDELNPVLHDDVSKDMAYLNNLVSGGLTTLKRGLFKIFDAYNNPKEKTGSSVPKQRNPCLDRVSLNSIRLVGPVVAKTDKDLANKWLNMAGGKLYRVVLPDECQNQLSPLEKAALFITIEPQENRIHFPSGVPDQLRGAELGRLIYLKAIEKLGYITSSIASSAGVKTIYEDFIKNPEYKDRLYTLILQKQILIIDKDAKQDLISIFRGFVKGKYTEQKYVGASEGLKQDLGKVYSDWYDSLGKSDMKSLIKKYEGIGPEVGDTVVDIRDNNTFTFGGQNTLNQGKPNERTYIWLSGDKFKDKYIDPSEKKHLRVIFRPEK